MTIDEDVIELADQMAHQALAFVRTTTGDPCLESISQWASLRTAIAVPIQNLRNHAKKKVAFNKKMNAARGCCAHPSPPSESVCSDPDKCMSCGQKVKFPDL